MNLIKNLNKKALTLLEIIVSTIILALVMTGLVNVFVAGRQFIQHSRNRMAGGEVGKKFLDPLQAYVRQDTWSSNPLGTKTKDSLTDGNYKADYTITDLNPSDPEPKIKKVKTTISWTE